MENKEEIYEIAILGRVTWNLHSLNNEGTVGNVTEPRTIVLADGTQTDGISGEMLKHMHAENMWKLEKNKSNFCEACKQLKPERADENKNVRGQDSPKNAVKEALNCELCDIHGFLVQRPTVARTSLIEFGWALGIPQIFRDIHTHARHSVQEQFLQIEEEKDIGNWENEKCSKKGCETKPEESKLYKVKNKWYCEEHLPIKTGQMIYHNPTRSGIYAIISVFQPWKIGLNNVSFNYEVNDIQRKSRYQLALKAYQAMFMRPEGAMTATRLPHIENFEGIIVVSKTNSPVPVISPLKDDYKDQIKKIKIAINVGENIDILEFNSVSQFIEKIKILLEKKPYKVEFKKE